MCFEINYTNIPETEIFKDIRQHAKNYEKNHSIKMCFIKKYLI